MTAETGDSGTAETDATVATDATSDTGAASGTRGTVDKDPGAGTASGARRTGRKVREGVVVSDKMTSTVVVAVTERVRHARYGKIVQRTRKLYAQDDTNEVRTGDRVRVMETRPLSKMKRWRVTSVVERAR